MYIITQKGNLVPLENVKVVKVVEPGGSMIVLRTGERIIDTRTPAEVFKSAYSPNPSITPIVESFEALSTSMCAFEACVTESLDALTAQLGEANKTVSASTNQLDNCSKGLLEVTYNAVSTSKEAKQLIGEINNAIQEI